jgi:hypothetical protein
MCVYGAGRLPRHEARGIEVGRAKVAKEAMAGKEGKGGQRFPAAALAFVARLLRWLRPG